jgi:hypothetical protein
MVNGQSSLGVVERWRLRNSGVSAVRAQFAQKNTVIDGCWRAALLIGGVAGCIPVTPDLSGCDVTCLQGSFAPSRRQFYNVYRFGFLAVSYCRPEDRVTREVAP